MDKQRKPSMWNICEPPGWWRFREQVYSEHYRRERNAQVETDDGTSWPVDLGEAGA